MNGQERREGDRCAGLSLTGTHDILTMIVRKDYGGPEMALFQKPVAYSSP